MTEEAVVSTRPVASTDSLAATIPVLSGVPSVISNKTEVLFPSREQYIEIAQALKDYGFETCADLCAVDYLNHFDRVLPQGVKPERFEVVINLASISQFLRVRLRVLVPESDPVCPTLFFLYPGTENMEREAYDLMGIIFDNHPDPTRILMPQDWEGHPLRKDYGVGRVPVQFKGAPGTAMTDEMLDDLGPSLIDDVSDTAQELAPESETSPVESMIERGGILRVPEIEPFDPADGEDHFGDGETMILNLGPQHPSTHGVLRMMLELQGETILRSKPIIGYLHTGMEKTGEELTYIQGATNVTRMDYLSPISNELVFSMAVEDLLGIENPPRATWIRMMMAELNRINSHVTWAATNGMDLASTTMMIFGFRERELILSFVEKTTGLRMNTNYIRPGGVAADLPDGWEDDVLAIADTIATRVDDYDELLTGQPIFRERTEGVGIIGPDLALAMSATGPILRASGVSWDLRRAMPYLAYDEVDFDVIVGTVGDTFDRYAVKLNEIRESVRIVRQCIEKMPAGDYRIQDKKVTPPPRARIDESMEALIHHFKLFTAGIEVPPGETYVAVESPRGELGCYMVSDGSNKPYRMHVRAPSFVNLQSVPALLRGTLVADAIAILSSVDPVLGEVDR